MPFNTPTSVNEYPPSAFRAKYGNFLAPNGILLPPVQVLKNKKLDKDAQSLLKKAFKVTIKKLSKMRVSCANCHEEISGAGIVCEACQVERYCSEGCRDVRGEVHVRVCRLLKQEAIDQVLECLPHPVGIGRDVLRGRGGVVNCWGDWLDRHTTIGGDLRSAATLVSQWWLYTPLPLPEDEVLEAALERLVTSIFSTVLTISHSVIWMTVPQLFLDYSCQIDDQLSGNNQSNELSNGHSIKSKLENTHTNGCSHLDVVKQEHIVDKSNKIKHGKNYKKQVPCTKTNGSSNGTNGDREASESLQVSLQDCFTKLSKKKSLHIHLLGADKPEVSMVESGLVQVCNRVLGADVSVHLTLVAPDLRNHPQTLAMTPNAPMKMGNSLSVSCYAGLYHDYWAEHVETDDKTMKVARPDMAIAIHPGLHTAEMWVLWRPTVCLLATQGIPFLITTYNKAEYEQSLEVLKEANLSIAFSGANPLGSKLTKQTPCEPDHVWAINPYVIAIDNSLSS